MTSLSRKTQGNRWGVLTDFSVQANNIDVTAFGDVGRSYVSGLGEIKFSGVAPATPEILKVISSWMYNGSPQFPIYAEEWMCLYCASPNPLPATHCNKCGAPRNWLIG